MIRVHSAIAWILAAAALVGCASRPVNEPITQVDPKSGYRPYLIVPKLRNNDQGTLFVLSFSGGGTRAAAFSYGVLEELRRTEIVAGGQRRRLIDEVDIITGVSGGSFTALAYALHGEKLFAEYEQRFLKRDVEGELLTRALNPFNWWKFVGGTAGRSELAAELYDEILFEGATFADLLARPGPAAVATGTDISTGSRLAFFQNDFDLLCTDLNKMRLSRAAATSSAVPVVLSAVTFDNYGGTCGYRYPGWVDVVANPDPKKRARPSARAYQRYLEMKAFQDRANRPYIHLVDGGVSDNLGVRGVLETLEELAVSSEFRGEIGFGGIRRIVLLVVNARSSPRTDWDQVESPPGMLSQLLQSTSVPIDRYSFETVETMKDRAEITRWRRELLVARKRLAGQTEAQAQASTPNVSLEAVDISFDALQDPKERAYYMDLPTSFALPAESIDRLREVAGRLMRQSEDYRKVVREMGGAAAK
jgi:NTE family protein